MTTPVGPATRHRITITDDQTCGTCRRPVGWTTFRATNPRDPDGGSMVVYFPRHFPDPDSARHSTSKDRAEGLDVERTVRAAIEEYERDPVPHLEHGDLATYIAARLTPDRTPTEEER